MQFETSTDWLRKKLWSKLRNRQMGYKFRRQYGIGKYVVDFYCPRLKLIIEIDGATHSTKEEIGRDKIRENYLKSLGLTVKRYTNNDVKENFSDVIYNIQDICERLSQTSPQPSPSQGEGAER